MAFNSFEYGLFLGVVVVLCWSLRKTRPQNLLILIASYYFYARWDWRLVPLLVFTTILNYLVGRGLENASGRKKRTLLMVGLSINLGILGFFKYFNFFVDSAVSLLNALGLHANPSSLTIILPIGISFYTFELIAYLIDVYREQLKPERDFLDFALFAGFFAQLLAGPIERGSALLPQIKRRPLPGPKQVESGILLIFRGLFKKIVIADVAANLINAAAFTAPGTVPPAGVWQAVYLFAVQIYTDFSAYTDIARGTARLLGIELTQNFRQPYFAGNVAEFWGRWHISLSTWLRDYIFYPFSRSMLRRYGNRRSILIQIAAHLLTMLVSGLWHGANLTFVLWGLLHGFYLSVHRFLFYRKIVPIKVRSTVGKQAWRIIGVLITFHLVLLTWVAFRTPEIGLLPDVCRQLARIIIVGFGGDGINLFAPVILLYSVMLVIDGAEVVSAKRPFFEELPGVVRSVVYTVAIFLMIFFAVKPYVPFFYFQF
jgi:alginate O-acetyltransferase complex protein AlgI